MHEERYEFSWWEDIKEMTTINLGAWALYTLSGRLVNTAKWPKNFRMSLNEKTKNNLKLLKDKILYKLIISCYFVLFL